MCLISAYCAVLLIWATTPLGIKWSNSSLSFSSAITLRMILALLLCAIVLRVQKKRLIQTPNDWRVFAAGAFGLFPNMLIVYWSAQYIPSGFVSLLLGFFPLFLGVFSRFYISGYTVSNRQLVSLLLAFIGLAFISVQQMQVSWQSIVAVFGVLTAAACWALSSVLVKRLGGGIDAMRQCTGTLTIAAPLFLIYWFIFDGKVPEHWQLQSQLAVVYLVVAGSCIGHTLYFYVLRHCALAATALLTLISPVLALGIGFVLLDELLKVWDVIGVIFILIALGIYSGALENLLKIGVRLHKKRSLKLESFSQSPN